MAQCKKFKEAQVTRLYKKAYREMFRWEDNLEPDFYDYISLTSKSTNCPITIYMAGILPTIACICGPQTQVAITETFKTGLNLNMMGIAAPGGGKSVVYGLITEVCDNIEILSGQNVLIESYSAAGLQVHQKQNGGYGLLTSDEGHQILSSLNLKQSKHEGERALLNKLWGGRGDSSVLKDGRRGFKSTSFSMAILVQPSPCLTEISQMNMDDGFFDRMMFLIDKPKHHDSTLKQEARNELKKRVQKALVKTLTTIFEHHQSNEVTYTFDQDAQNKYDEVIDEHTSEFNALYPSASDGDSDEETGATCSASSKDQILIPRLAAVLHILQHTFTNVINQKEGIRTRSKAKDDGDEFPKYIGNRHLEAAMRILVNSKKQKAIFLEAVSGTLVSEQSLKPVDTITKRIVNKVLTISGPMVTPRVVSRNLYKIDCAMTRDQLEELSSKMDFGSFKQKGKDQWMKPDVFFKPHPISVPATHPVLDLGKVDYNAYQVAFFDTKGLSKAQTKLVLQHHPHADMLNDILSQDTQSSQSSQSQQ